MGVSSLGIPHLFLLVMAFGNKLGSFLESTNHGDVLIFLVGYMAVVNLGGPPVSLPLSSVGIPPGTL